MRDKRCKLMKLLSAKDRELRRLQQKLEQHDETVKPNPMAKRKSTATKRSLDKLVDNEILRKKIHSLEVENENMRLQEVVDGSSSTVMKISARKHRKTAQLIEKQDTAAG